MSNQPRPRWSIGPRPGCTFVGSCIGYHPGEAPNCSLDLWECQDRLYTVHGNVLLGADLHFTGSIFLQGRANTFRQSFMEILTPYVEKRRAII